MRRAAAVVLVSGIILLAGLTLMFFTSANLTHLNCCSIDWVESAPTAVARQQRAEVRARAIREVVDLRRKSQEYALICLVGALGLAGFYYICSKREAVSPKS